MLSVVHFYVHGKFTRVYLEAFHCNIHHTCITNIHSLQVVRITNRSRPVSLNIINKKASAKLFGTAKNLQHKQTLDTRGIDTHCLLSVHWCSVTLTLHGVVYPVHSV